MTCKFEVLEQNVQSTLSIRTTTSQEELPKLIGKSYMEIYEYLNQLGACPAGPPFTAYYNLDMQNLDVELGFPVADRLSGKDNIQAGEIPKGFYVSNMYKGPYSDMHKVYDEMFKWIADNNYEPTGVYYEYYLNSPEEVSESDLLTRIVWSVVKK